MPTLDCFHTPAGQAVKDFGTDQAGLDAYEAAWNNNVRRWTLQSIVGNPWSNQYDDNRSYYFDPQTTDVPDGAPVVPITWNPFPNRLFNFFQDPTAPPDKHLTTEQIYELADCGAIEIDGKVTPINQIQVPGTLCPTNDWSGQLVGYNPDGPRGWLDEYCEWSVKRDDSGKLRQVMFTCENPSYWFTMWRQDPDLVTKLYQTYVNPSVQREDLYLRDSKGNPVQDPLTGDYAYDPTNKWNSRTETLADRGGAVHLSSPPNTLSAEIYLAAAATIARQVGNSDPQTLICCAQYGRPRRNSDPHIGQQVNQTANIPHRNLFLTLLDPVGLYIQQPNFSLWAVPNQPTYDVKSFWSIERGQTDPQGRGNGYDSILHAVFTVPDGLEPEDIVITDPRGEKRPLQWAGQIAETFNIALRATGIPATASASTPVPQPPRPCVVNLTADDDTLQPWPVQFLPYEMFEAGSAIDLAPSVPQGTDVEMALLVQGGLEDATVEFDPPDGVQVDIVKFIPNTSGTPGQTSGGGTQAYILKLSVAEDAPPGDRSVRVTNQQKQAPAGGVPWLPGMLEVTAKGS